MIAVIGFVLFVGIGSTIAIDLLALLSCRMLGISTTNWGVVGRWISQMPAGHLRLVPGQDAPPTGTETATGWLFHYGVGMAYAALLPAIGGMDFIADPAVMPVIVVGFLLSSLAGTMVLMPALGAGLFGRNLPDRGGRIAYLLFAHGVFAAAQFALSSLYAGWSAAAL